MYRRIRSSKQGVTQQGSQGGPGSLDSAQSTRIAEQLSAVRMSNSHANAAFGAAPHASPFGAVSHASPFAAAQHATPMEDVVHSGPDLYDPEMLASRSFAAAMADGDSSQRLNETGRQAGGFMPGASGKAIVAEPSSMQMSNPPAAHAVRTDHSRCTKIHDLTAFIAVFVQAHGMLQILLAA